MQTTVEPSQPVGSSSATPFCAHTLQEDTLSTHSPSLLHAYSPIHRPHICVGSDVSHFLDYPDKFALPLSGPAWETAYER